MTNNTNNSNLSTSTNSTNQNHSNLNNTSKNRSSSNPYKDSFTPRSTIDHLTPEEQELWRLAYFAGLPMPSEVLKNINELCKYGCDPEHIVETINTFCQSYYDKKESLKHSRNQESRSRQNK